VWQVVQELVNFIMVALELVERVLKPNIEINWDFVLLEGPVKDLQFLFVNRIFSIIGLDERGDGTRGECEAENPCVHNNYAINHLTWSLTRNVSIPYCCNSCECPIK
jgi:hypothetical protein